MRTAFAILLIIAACVAVYLVTPAPAVVVNGVL